MRVCDLCKRKLKEGDYITEGKNITYSMEPVPDASMDVVVSLVREEEKQNVLEVCNLCIAEAAVEMFAEEVKRLKK